MDDDVEKRKKTEIAKQLIRSTYLISKVVWMGVLTMVDEEGVRCKRKTKEKEETY